jgi:hypothetical protein
VVLLALGGWAALRRGIPLSQPGRWLTDRPLAGARPDRPALDAARLRRRLLLETAVWIAAVTAWVLVGARDGLLIFGTGLASAAVRRGPGVRRHGAGARRRGRARGAPRRRRRPGLGHPGARDRRR